MPAVVSVVEKINEPRYPSFKGIMAAKKKPVETLGVSDIGLDAGSVGLGAAWSAVAEFAARPPKAAGTVVAEVKVLGLHHGPRLSEWERHYGSLVQNQVEAVLTGTWPEALRAMVATVTPADFEVRGDDLDECADLIGIARVRA